MHIRAFTLLFGALFLSLYAAGQDKSSARFGKISPEDFRTDQYKIDTGTSAVVVADIGSSAFESGNEGFIQVFKQYKRVHILNKNGYDEANLTIYLYVDGQDEERVNNLKAVTYNLENGKVVETKMESKSVFTEKRDKKYHPQKVHAASCKRRFHHRVLLFHQLRVSVPAAALGFPGCRAPGTLE